MTMFRINAGKYRHVITFQALQDTADTYGENTATWVNTITTRAGIFPISGKEYYSTQLETKTPEITHKIQLRYQSGITSEMRVKFGDRIFDIISPPINFQEKRLELQLMCREREVGATE